MKNQPTPTLRWRLVWQLIAWLGVVLLSYLSLIPAPPELPGPLAWDKLQHTLVYAFLMIWFRQAFQPHWRWPVFLLTLGIALEFMQGWSGHRFTELSDILANTLGVGVGLYLAIATPVGRSLIWLEKLFRV